MGTGSAATLGEQLARVQPLDRSRLDAALELALDRGMDTDLEIQVDGADDGAWLRCLVRIRALADTRGSTAGEPAQRSDPRKDCGAVCHRGSAAHDSARAPPDALSPHG
jgi:hypothetical protein